MLLEQMRTRDKGLIYCNLIDFDMLYGHRRDVKGFGLALEEFDEVLFRFFKEMRKDDLLIISADHGNDPTYRGSDHTREYIPVLAALGSSRKPAISLGELKSFADVGATVCDFFDVKPSSTVGRSFLPTLKG